MVDTDRLAVVQVTPEPRHAITPDEVSRWLGASTLKRLFTKNPSRIKLAQQLLLSHADKATYQEAEKDRRRAGEKLARAYLANAQAGAKQVKEAQNETSDFIYRMARRLEEEKQKKLDILRHMASAHKIILKKHKQERADADGLYTVRIQELRLGFVCTQQRLKQAESLHQTHTLQQQSTHASEVRNLNLALESFQISHVAQLQQLDSTYEVQLRQLHQQAAADENAQAYEMQQLTYFHGRQTRSLQQQLAIAAQAHLSQQGQLQADCGASLLAERLAVSAAECKSNVLERKVAGFELELDASVLEKEILTEALAVAVQEHAQAKALTQAHALRLVERIQALHTQMSLAKDVASQSQASLLTAEASLKSSQAAFESADAEASLQRKASQAGMQLLQASLDEKEGALVHIKDQAAAFKEAAAVQLEEESRVVDQLRDQLEQSEAELEQTQRRLVNSKMECEDLETALGVLRVSRTELAQALGEALNAREMAAGSQGTPGLQLQAAQAALTSANLDVTRINQAMEIAVEQHAAAVEAHNAQLQIVQTDLALSVQLVVNKTDEARASHREHATAKASKLQLESVVREKEERIVAIKHRMVEMEGVVTTKTAELQSCKQFRDEEQGKYIERMSRLEVEMLEMQRLIGDNSTRVPQETARSEAAQESTTHKLLLNERLQHHVLRQASEQAAIRHADIEKDLHAKVSRLTVALQAMNQQAFGPEKKRARWQVGRVEGFQQQACTEEQLEHRECVERQNMLQQLQQPQQGVHGTPAAAAHVPEIPAAHQQMHIQGQLHPYLEQQRLQQRQQASAEQLDVSAAELAEAAALQQQKLQKQQEKEVEEARAAQEAVEQRAAAKLRKQELRQQELRERELRAEETRLQQQQREIELRQEREQAEALLKDQERERERLLNESSGRRGTEAEAPAVPETSAQALSHDDPTPSLVSGQPEVKQSGRKRIDSALVCGYSEHLKRMAHECEVRKPSEDQQSEFRKQCEQKKLAQDLLDKEKQHAEKLQEREAKLLPERIEQLQLQYAAELEAGKLLELQKEEVLMKEEQLSLSAMKAACAAALESFKPERGHEPAAGIDFVVTRTPMDHSAGVAGQEGGASITAGCSSSVVANVTKHPESYEDIMMRLDGYYTDHDAQHSTCRTVSRPEYMAARGISRSLDPSHGPRYRAWKLEENAQSAARAAAKEPQQLAQQQGAQQHVAKQHQLAQQHQVQHQQYSLPTAFASNNISYSQQSGSACEGQLYGGRGGGVGGRAVGTGASEWRKGAPAAAAAAKAGTPHTGASESQALGRNTPGPYRTPR